MGKIIAIANQKGGVGKTTTTVNLGIGLARKGHKVLLIDCDSQGSLTICLGIQNPDNLKDTLYTGMTAIIEDKEDFDFNSIIKTHEEGVNFIPSNIELAGMEVQLMSALSREHILTFLLKQYINQYDFIIIDCMPSLGMLTVNALVSADEVIIPCKAEYLSFKGLELLLKTITMVKKRLNPKLSITGILLTMVQTRSVFHKEMKDMLKMNYSSEINIFETIIPTAIKVAETSAFGKSIYSYDKKSKISMSYLSLTNEFEEKNNG